MELENYDKIINHVRKLVQEKLKTISFSFAKPRPKRSILPQMGSIIKLITGNLDSKDGDRYDLLLNEIRANQKILQQSTEQQYTFNIETTKRFDLTVQNIEHNEQLLEKKISQLTDYVQNELGIDSIFDTIIAEQAYNQLIILYNNLHSVLQDIENSLTFCRAHIFHPSILKFEELQRELEKLEKNSRLGVPLEVENLSDLQKLLQVECRVEELKIIYFLSFPINLDTNFELYHLLSIPSMSNLGYSTIIPPNKYFLKSKNLVKSLNDICTLGNPFQCRKSDINNNLNGCELQILQEEQTNTCEHTSLEIGKNTVEYIPEINQLLVIFSTKDQLKFELENEVEIKELKGIFLIEPGKDKIIFKNQTLKSQTITRGKPSLLSDVNLNLNTSKLSDIKIRFNSLQLDNIKISQIIPKNEAVNKLAESQKPWIVLSCITLIIVILLIIILFSKDYLWNLHNTQRQKDTLPVPITGSSPKMSLPRDAKF